MGIDDREDKLVRFCLVTSTYTIEQYCKRRFLRKKHIETLHFYGDLLLPLMEYPVSSISTVYTMKNIGEAGMPLEKDFFCLVPISSNNLDVPKNLYISPALERYRRFRAIKVEYWAGYVENPHPCGFSTLSFCDAKTPAKAKKTAASLPPIPQDLAAACMELASWNMGRYKGRRVGMTGNVRGSGRDAEHFEMSMPENVRSLLEPYRRKLI